jgi:hypothetical protein
MLFCGQYVVIPVTAVSWNIINVLMSEAYLSKQGAPKEGKDNLDRTGCRQDTSLSLILSLLPI